MRISDWSSDVCSSDLPGAQARRGACDGVQHMSATPRGGRPALVLLTPNARKAAQLLMAAFPAWEVYAPDDAALVHALPLGKATETIADLFMACRPVIGICAAGILIRAVASRLAAKQR